MVKYIISMFKVYQQEMKHSSPDRRTYKVDKAAYKLKSQKFLLDGLSDFLGHDLDPAQLLRHDSGQPYLVGEGPLAFSLSHSDDFFVLACSRTHDIGIDIQAHRDFNEKVFARICGEEERRLILAPNSPADSPVDLPISTEIFFKVWTIKEAALKCLGLGFQFSARDLQIDEVSQKIRLLSEPKAHMIFLQNEFNLEYKKLELFEGTTTHIVWNSN